MTSQGSSKKGLLETLGLKKKSKASAPVEQKQLRAKQVARLFDKSSRDVQPIKPSKLKTSEVQDSARLSSLRGALYSDD